MCHNDQVMKSAGRIHQYMNRLRKIWDINTLEFYSTIKNEIMPFAGTGDHYVKSNKLHLKFNLGREDMKLKREKL